mgnify:CR=1 FL=1
MYKIKETTGNLVIVSPLKIVNKTSSGLILPDTKGKHQVCKVISVGKEVNNNEIQEGVLVAVPSVLLDAPLDKNKYHFEEPDREYYLIQQYGIELILEEVENAS